MLPIPNYGKFQKKEEYIILTKNKDFYYRVTLNGAPLKVIWITPGNCGMLRLYD